MGRTLHYEISYDDAQKMKDSDWNAIHALAEQYQRNHEWSCESVDLDPYSYYPRWRKWFSDSQLPDNEKAWGFLNALYDKLRSEGKTHTQAVKVMLQRKLIALHRRPKGEHWMTDADGTKHYADGSVSAFTKVRDNEYDALFVLRFVLDVSRLVPAVTVTIKDEGHFLLCPLRIRAGKAQPDQAGITESLDYWQKEEAKKAGFISSWCSEKYENFKVFSTWSTNEWGEPDTFCRRVDPKHFAEFQSGKTQNLEIGDPALVEKMTVGIAEIMKEFSGDYYKATGQM